MATSESRLMHARIAGFNTHWYALALPVKFRHERATVLIDKETPHLGGSEF